MTAERGLRTPALGAGAALTAMLFASRLPATLDFILPRRAGWFVFETAFMILSRPWAAQAYSVAASLAILAALSRFLWLAAGAARGRAWSAKDFLSRGFALALVLALTRWSFSIWFDVFQTIWFPFGSLNLIEPFANMAVCSALAYTAMFSAVTLLSSRPDAARKLLIGWAAVAAAAGLLAADPVLKYGGINRLYVVLTEEAGRPGQTSYVLFAPSSDESADRAEAELSKGAAKRLPKLRKLYEDRAKLLDPAGLRRSLLVGVRFGDDLARSLLLAHLSVAQPSAEAISAVGALADETAHRIGPMGASRIALAYAHLGERDQAALWAKRGSAMPRGVPEGLLNLPEGGALKPGRLSGRIEGLRPERIALYVKSDPAAPYYLDAAALVAATKPDKNGRFAFSGLAAGRYYLAFAFPPDAGIRVSGHRGDLILGGRAAALELPALTFRRAE